MTDRKHKGRHFDILTGRSLPFENYETEENFSLQLQAGLRRKGMVSSILGIITAIGLA